MLSKKLIIVLALLIVTGTAFAETGGYFKTAWTGGSANAVDGIASPADGDFCITNGTIDSTYKVTTVHQFNSGSSAAESGIENIAPDDATAGRWEVYQPAFCFGTIQPTITDGVEWFDTSQ